MAYQLITNSSIDSFLRRNRAKIL